MRVLSLRRTVAFWRWQASPALAAGLPLGRRFSVLPATACEWPALARMRPLAPEGAAVRLCPSHRLANVIAFIVVRLPMAVGCFAAGQPGAKPHTGPKARPANPPALARRSCA